MFSLSLAEAASKFGSETGMSGLKVRIVSPFFADKPVSNRSVHADKPVFNRSRERARDQSWLRMTAPRSISACCRADSVD